MQAARATGKPVVVDFIGYWPKEARDGNLHFARTLSDAAEKAVALADRPNRAESETREHTQVDPVQFDFVPPQRFVRGLYSGGTLAYEAQLILRDYLDDVYSNAPLNANYRLPNASISQAHTILDLGADEFTVGRLHPMLDNDLRIRRLKQEANDHEVAIILLDVVLGYGAHPDPASELAPAIVEARGRARNLKVIAAVIGTEDDPQNLATQVQRLKDAGARVVTDHAAAVRGVAETVLALNPAARQQPGRSEGRENERLERTEIEDSIRVDAAVLEKPFAAVNVGLESFYASLKQQDVPAIQVDWRPPAGGDEKLMAILERLKSKA